MRRVSFEPGVVFFKPAGVGMRDLEEVVVTIDEFEALRLSDFEKMTQSEAAVKMKISQPTFNRLLSSAHEKIAEALVEGKAIRIRGGNYFLK
jgi:predicted DNA-binding protein (UPF0251 family)